MTQTVSLSFYRYGSAASRLWAFAMMGLARRPLARTPDIGFWKLCGSGGGHGFTPVPNTAVYAVLATWPDHATATHRLGQGVFARFAARATEDWSVLLSPTSARGTWSGHAPFVATDGLCDGPIAALTRATLRPATLLRFWRRVPAISEVIGNDPDVLFRIGIGEVPWLHQITFSIWPDAAALARFARRGPHAEASRAARSEGWFREDLFARFEVRSEMGTWGDASPLARLETAA